MSEQKYIPYLPSDQQWLSFLESLWYQGLEAYIDTQSTLRIQGPEHLKTTAQALLKHHKPRLYQSIKKTPMLLTGFPLSAAQQDIFFAQLRNAGKPCFNHFLAVSLEDEKQIENVHNNWISCQQHIAEVRLQLFYRSPHQVAQFYSTAPIAMESVDQGFKNTEERNQWMESFADQTFSFDKKALIKVCLLTDTMRKKTYLLICVHHIIADFNACLLLLRHLKNGIDKSLPSLQHYNLQQQAHAVRPAATAHAQAKSIAAQLPSNYYWRNKAHDSLNNEYSFDIGSRLQQNIHLCCKQHKISKTALGLTALQILLFRYTGTEAIGIHIPASGRSQDNHNIFASFAFLQEHTIHVDTQLSALDMMHINQQQLQQRLQQNQQRQHTQAVDIIFCWHKINRQKIGFNSEQLLRFEQRSSAYPLALNVYQFEHTSFFNWRYKPDIFPLSSIKQFCAHIKTIIKQICDDAHTSIGALRLSSKTELKQIEQWSKGPRHHAKPRQLLHIFQQQCAKYAAKCAIFDRANSYTYSQLNNESNQLAHYLISQHIKAGDIIAVQHRRCIDTIILYLAILKCGASYLSIPEHWDEATVSRHINALTISAIFCEKRIANLSIPCLPLHRAVWLGFPNTAISPTHTYIACYVYSVHASKQDKAYTLSAETIINICHAPLYINLNNYQRIAHAAQTGLDIAQWEIWSALLNGASLYIIPDSAVCNTQQLAVHLKEQQIDILLLQTALFNQHARHANIFSQLDYLLVIGDALNIALAEAFSKRFKKEHFLYAYSTGEHGIFSSVWPVDSHYYPYPPIGSPIDGCSIYILNKARMLCAIGETGEIHLAGIQDDKHHKCISAAFSDKPLLPCGDLARWRDGGVIELLTRSTRQIRIATQDIDLDKLQYALQYLPCIEHVYITADAMHDIRIYCIFSTSSQQPPDIQHIKHILYINIPVTAPYTIYACRTFPLTPDGNIDIEQLQHTACEVHESSIEPNATEKRIISLWQSVLNTAHIPLDVCFFDLGGNSLLAAQLLPKLQRHFHSKITLEDIFLNTQVKQLAATIDMRQATLSTNDVTQEFEEGIL